MASVCAPWDAMLPAIEGISLKKGDYVIGAAITDSDETRDKERDECAAQG